MKYTRAADDGDLLIMKTALQEHTNYQATTGNDLLVIVTQL